MIILTIHCFPGSNGLMSKPYEPAPVCDELPHGESSTPSDPFSTPTEGGLLPSIPVLLSGQPDSVGLFESDHALKQRK